MDNLIDSASPVKEIYNSTYDYGIFTSDLEGKINTWNVGAERITGFLSNEIIGRDNGLLFTAEDRARDEPRQEMHIAKTTGRAADYRWHLRKDGSRFWADGVLTMIRDESGQHIGYLKILRDITDRKLAEGELHRIANSDMLIGLPNRFSFEAHLEEMIAMACCSDQPMALHLIDLDRFKQVNDSLGHHAGDLLLQQAAQRMRRVLRDSDFVARLGGDEFVLLQPNMPAIQAGAELAAKLNGVLSQPFDIGGQEVRISGSIGIAICPDDAIESDQLLKKADLALYRAKADGKGKFHYFTEKLDSAAHQRCRDLAELRGALERNEFWMRINPKWHFPPERRSGWKRCCAARIPCFPATR